MPSLPSSGRRMWRSFLKSFAPRNTIPHRRSPFGRIEMLEDRSVPATFNVNTFLDTAAANLSTGVDGSGNISLRSALQAINSQGGTHTIDLQTGTYLLSLGELPINGSPTKATVTIVGEGSANTIIDAQNASRVFRNYSGNTATLEGVTITHGLTTGSSDAADGGGIFNQGTLTIIQSLVANNSAPTSSTSDGGGIYNSFGTLTILASRLTGNTSGARGGGLGTSDGVVTINDSMIDNNHSVGTSGGGISSSSNLTISRTTFQANTAQSTGGGVFQTASIRTLIISECRFADNAASFGGGLHTTSATQVSRSFFQDNTAALGGAIDSSFSALLAVDQCVFSGNSATGNTGGAIYNSGPATIQGSTFTGNTATGIAGAILNSNSSKAVMTISDCTLAGNSAGSIGGGGIANHGTVTVVHSTLTGNSASTTDNRGGGGIWNTGTLTLLNSIVAGNTGHVAGPDVNGPVASGRRNLIGQGGSALTGISDGDANGNRVGVDPLLNALADNGGLTFTMSLQAGSPAIGNGGAITTLTTNAAAADTALVVADATAIARIPGSYFIRIGSEEIEVTSVDVATNTLTVVRGSGAAAIAAGAEVHLARDQRGLPRSLPTSIGAFQAAAIGAPDAPDLLDAFDSGVSNADNLTNLDNGNPATALQFLVGGVVSGATVAIYADGTEIGSEVASGASVIVTTNGTFDLVDGSHVITARQTIAGGSASADSGTLTIAIDTVAPTQPAAPDLQAGSDLGSSPTDNLTSATSLNFAIAGGTPFFRVLRNGTVISGAFESGPAFGATNQPAGANDYTVAAVDAAGNLSPSSSALQVTIDTAAPAVSAPDLMAGSDTGASATDDDTSDTTPTFSGTAEAGASVTLLAGTRVLGTTTAAGGIWSITSATLADGTYSVFARATDVAGNSVDSAALAVTIRTNGPAVSAPDLAPASDTGASSTDNNTRDTTPTFTGTAEAGAGITLLSGSTVLGIATATGGTWSITIAALADGVFDIFARATDAAGNSADSATLAVTIDTTGPTATVTRAAGQPATTSASSPSFTVQFAVNFSEPIAGLSVSDLNLGTTAEGAITGVTGSGSNYTVTVGNLTQPGTVTVNVNAGAGTDLAGNASTGSPPGEQVGVSFTTQTIVDVTPATILTGESATITATVGAPAGGAAPGGTILFSLTGSSGTTNRTITIAGGSASATFPSLAAGNYTVNATYQPTSGFVTSTGSDAFTVTDPVVVIPVDQNAIGQYAGVAGRTVTVFNSNGDVRRTFSPFTAAEAPNGVRVAVADVNGDGAPDVIAVTGPGPATVLRAFDGRTNGLLYDKQLYVGPHGEPFTGGAFVAAGDLNGDSRADLAVTPDEGGGPRVLLFNGTNGADLASFFAIDDPNFRGGARATIGDLNNDGVNDVLVSAGFGGGPRVAGFSGATLFTTRAKLFSDFFVFEEQLRNGAYVTIGDLNGDGYGDIIGGGGPGGAPRVLALDSKALLQGGAWIPLLNFFAGDADLRGGVRVAAKDFNGDGKTDLITGSGNTGWLYGYDGADLTTGNTDPSRDERLGGFFSPRNGIYVG